MSSTAVRGRMGEGQEVATLPTPEALADAIKRLQDATEAVSRIRWQVDQVADNADLPPENRAAIEPFTFEQIGRLYVYTKDAASRLEEISEYATATAALLWQLDDLRAP